ncbi:MAG TPA: hypothetical protein VFW45_13800 [Candidatus Polarisedimenticolia bacterium]|nr:hypothetical protein [Candidatus Polarisedimenticolia bacterium]
MRGIRAARALLTLGTTFGLIACQEALTPVPYRLGQAIPLERWMLKIRQPEMVAASMIKGFQDFRISNKDSKVLVVHLDLMPKSQAAEDDPNAAEKGFIKLMWDCRLKDREGQEYRLGLPLAGSHFRMLKSGGMMSDTEMRDALFSVPESRVPRDWALLFAVPQGRSGFTLFIRNRTPEEGQPALVSVDLGR